MSAMPQLMEAPKATAPLDVTTKKALAASTVGYAMDGYDFLPSHYRAMAFSADVPRSRRQQLVTT